VSARDGAGVRAARGPAPRGFGSGPASSPRDLWRGHLPAVALFLLGLVLYARGLVLGFVGDDLVMLDAALRLPLGELMSGRHGIAGDYRPVARELYFWGWGRVVGLGPGGFHLVNALTYAAVVVMIERLGRGYAGPRVGRLAAAAFLMFPQGSALLAWVSCAQDLIVLFWAVAALLFYRHGRHAAAGLATALAVLSGEMALVLPALLAVMEWGLHRGAAWGARLRRLAPGIAGLGVAVAVSVAARASWPAGAAIAAWSPRQLAGAWRVPLDFARTLLPPDTGAGIAQALESQPAWLALVAVMAAFAVPSLAPETATRPERARPDTRLAPDPIASRASSGTRSMVVLGLAIALLAMLPVGFVIERWRGDFFPLPAVGAALALGALLAPLAPALTRGILALAAVVNFAAGGIHRPLEARAGTERLPHVNYAFFRETAALSDGLLAALEPWCGSIGSLPRTFMAGVPPNPAFETAIGPGLRVTCRDTVARVRFLAEFTPADAGRDFGVLRFDPRTASFMHERADARVRARVGEGFLIHTRFDVAAACFEAAAGHAPDRELSYPLAVALAAAERAAEARAIWRDAVGRGASLEAGAMTTRLSGGPGAGDATRGRTLLPLVAAALREPWEAEPHRALGRALLALDRPREATFELAVAAGIGRENADLAWLAQGYEAMGLMDEAHEAYRRALEIGLAGDLYTTTRDRFLVLARRNAAALDRLQTRP